MADVGRQFLVALNRNLTDSTALQGSLPANLRSAAGVYSTAQIDAFLLQKATKGANSDITSLSGLTTPLTPGQGGTGVSSLAALKSALSLNNVDNTSDLDKPISTAVQLALDAFNGNTTDNNLAVGGDTFDQNGAGAFNLRNTAFGVEALKNLTNHAENTAVGSKALTANTAGNGNSALGSNALAAVTTGPYNTGLGSNAGRAVTTGSGNTAVGHGTMGQDDSSPAFSTADYNTAVGGWALQEVTTGSGNTAVGMNSLMNITTGEHNVAVGLGANAGTLDSTATAVGNDASRNVAIGYDALQQNTGDDNVAIGYRALVGNTTGTKNVAIGATAFSSDAALTNTIAIGYGVDPSASNQVMIGNTDITHTVLRGGLSLASGRKISFTGESAPGSADYAIYGDGTSTIINGPGATGLVALAINNTQVVRVDGTNARTTFLYGTTGTGYSNCSVVVSGDLGVAKTLRIDASTTAGPHMSLTAGVAPTSSNNGDLWFDGTALKIKIGGTVRTVTVS